MMLCSMLSNMSIDNYIYKYHMHVLVIIYYIAFSIFLVSMLIFYCVSFFV